MHPIGNVLCLEAAKVEALLLLEASVGLKLVSTC